MLTTLKGLVLRERPIGENDKILDILSGSHGLITVYAKGVRKANAKNSATSQAFSYATFCLSENKDKLYLNSSEPIRIFYDLRLDIEKFALANYFAELIMFTSTSEQANEGAMRLILNSLHFLSEGKKSNDLLKSIFELRLMTEIGMTPNLLGCCECLKYTDRNIQFDLKYGKLYCESCCGARDLKNFEVLDETLLHAIRYIALADMERLFSFRLSDEYMPLLANITERYVKIQLDKRFQTLDFYKIIKIGN